MLTFQNTSYVLGITEKAKSENDEISSDWDQLGTNENISQYLISNILCLCS